MDPCHTALRTASLQNTSRSSRLQMFFKIDALKSFANFTGKHLSSSLFCQGVPYETENWHAWSNEQFFSKRRFFRYLSVCLKRTQIVKIRCIYIGAWFSFQQTITCSKSQIETRLLKLKLDDVVLMTLLLILNLFHTFFWCFYIVDFELVLLSWVRVKVMWIPGHLIMNLQPFVILCMLFENITSN